MLFYDSISSIVLWHYRQQEIKLSKNITLQLIFLFFLVHYTMPSSKKSNVWKCFTKIIGNGNVAKCKICQKSIKYCGNTSNMFSHVKTIHKAAFLEIIKGNSQALNKVDPSTFEEAKVDLWTIRKYICVFGKWK